MSAHPLPADGLFSCPFGGAVRPGGSEINEPRKPRIDSARERIDDIDEQLIRLLADRIGAVEEVARAKGEKSGRLIDDPEREQERLKAWIERAEAHGLSGYFAGQVLKEVLAHSRRLQEPLVDAVTDDDGAPLRVGYQGVPHSYSDLTAGKLFATRTRRPVERTGYATFTDAVDALRAGKVTYALLPVENSIGGAIAEVNRLLSGGDLFIVDEDYWEVKHVLAGVSGATTAGVRRVRSHEAAFAQCAQHLSGLTGVTAEPWFDTAGAAESVSELGDPAVAAICSEEAALAHGLVILERNLADDAQNLTRFLLLGTQAETPAPRLAKKTSLVITLDHRQGALARCLTVFDRAGINLTRIESRPRPQNPWRYQFFIDFITPNEADAYEGALDEIRGHCHVCRVLGTYPARSQSMDAAPPPAPVAPARKPEPVAAVEPGRAAITVGEHVIGNGTFTLILGPCAVESRAQIRESAAIVRAAGAHLLRGGAFKPRTSPHSFQGLGLEGLEYLREAGREYGLPVVTEAMRTEDVAAIAASADVIQVGARNMQNFSLLKALGQVDRPILLKRGMSATVAELLAAAEYITSGGNRQVIFCERGIRTFETATRSTLDVAAVSVLKAKSPYPVIVDPSHAAGERELVIPLALAAAAAGADGLIVEMHPDPATALCDKDQALTADDLAEMRRMLEPIVTSRGLTL